MKNLSLQRWCILHHSKNHKITFMESLIRNPRPISKGLTSFGNILLFFFIFFFSFFYNSLLLRTRQNKPGKKKKKRNWKRDEKKIRNWVDYFGCRMVLKIRPRISGYRVGRNHWNRTVTWAVLWQDYAQNWNFPVRECCMISHASTVMAPILCVCHLLLG